LHGVMEWWLIGRLCSGWGLRGWLWQGRSIALQFQQSDGYMPLILFVGFKSTSQIFRVWSQYIETAMIWKFSERGEIPF
jgi:hypothetical protein